jgi:hypothetical protein
VRSGIALVLVLVVLAFVEALTTGLIVLATQTRVSSAAQIRSQQAQSLADFTVQSLINSWPQNSFDTVAVGRSLVVPVAGASASVEHLTAASYLISSEVQVGGGQSVSRARSAALVRTLDKSQVILEFNDGILVDSARSPSDSLVLGGLKWAELASIADVAGDSAWALVVATTDLVISGGARQGIIAVEGHLTLTNGAEFSGVVVARDGVTIENGANVEGSIRTLSGTISTVGGSVTYSSVAVSQAAQIPASKRPVWQSRRFIPAF